MTMEEIEPNSTSDHIMDWLEDSVSYLPSFFDDPYSSGEIDHVDLWWPQVQGGGGGGGGLDVDQLFDGHSTFSNINSAARISPSSTDHHISDHHLPTSDFSRKRKASDSDHLNPKLSDTDRKNMNLPVKESDNIVETATEKAMPFRKSSGTKRAATKSGSGNIGANSESKEGRWAEQLLNPCAAAITAGNMTRVQHLLYVLHELASPTGDANHRLAAHGLRALTNHLSSSSISGGAINFISAKPKFFQKSLIDFNDINPWFTIPNNIANSSILQTLANQDRSKNLHILDIGVSHGVQWPTLLEALTRRSGGPPPLVRLTVISPTVDDVDPPFAVGPPGYNFSLKLLSFAKAINLNLEINRLDNYPLQKLNSQAINSFPAEILIVSAQFRLHHLNHNSPNDHRTEFLRALRNLEPKGVILSENDVDCSCRNCGDFATGFSRRVDYLWRFLDSTSAAFKGRESEERRMMEGEAAKSLTYRGEMNDRKEKWCERMRSFGFVGEAHGEDAMDGARALLRKYDSNWEMRMEGEKDGGVGLWWKGQPVSFSSFWKTDSNFKLH